MAFEQARVQAADKKSDFLSRESLLNIVNFPFLLVCDALFIKNNYFRVKQKIVEFVQVPDFYSCDTVVEFHHIP
jgi:hypothetical protein